MDFDNITPMDSLEEKWTPILEHKDLEPIQDSYKRKVTAVLLENEEKALREQTLTETPMNALGGNLGGGAVAGNSSNYAGFDPVLISLVRRSMPNLMAYDVCGVQPMSAPTGLIFAMRSKYADISGAGAASFAKEALFNEADTSTGHTGGAYTSVDNNSTDPFGGAGHAGANTKGFKSGALVANSERLGEGAAQAFREMGFTIERVAVEARTRALKAQYTTELAQDLKAVHGLDAESELANILSTEILAEINREVIRKIYNNAKLGAAQGDLAFAPGAGKVAVSLGNGTANGTTFTSHIREGVTGGIYDINRDADGRWSAERFRGLMFQIEREANQIAKETRRGKGNFVIVSSDVASALAMGGFLNISPALNVSLNVDDTGNTFAGVLNGKMKVYIDPYAGSSNFVCVGYRGSSPYDAGMFYCPYVPLQMVRAVGEDTFQPRIGFKTRYGMVTNPFVGDANTNNINATGVNQYYRIFQVVNLHGQGNTTS
jgi:hypothetical protein